MPASSAAGSGADAQVSRGEGGAWGSGKGGSVDGEGSGGDDVEAARGVPDEKSVGGGDGGGGGREGGLSEH